MSIGETIKRCRKQKGLTQSSLAEQIGVSMQAVSKWETNAGMPDISQIVPLARVLGVTSDKLLGLTYDAEEEEYSKIIRNIEEIYAQYDYTSQVSAEENKKIYDMLHTFFCVHPTHTKAALWCIRSANKIIGGRLTEEKDHLEVDCERYLACIVKYETDATEICSAYYHMAELYNLLGEKSKSAEMLEKLPHTFGDKNYLEAEIAMSAGEYEKALIKCKKSFAANAHIIARCIRMVAMIIAHHGEAGQLNAIDLNKYMLRILNAFLSGGGYLPYRQMYQKLSLLAYLVWQCVQVGKYSEALDFTEQLMDSGAIYYNYLRDGGDTDSLMFIPESATEKVKDPLNVVVEYMKQGVESCIQSPDVKKINPNIHNPRYLVCKEKLDAIVVN